MDISTLKRRLWLLSHQKQKQRPGALFYINCRSKNYFLRLTAFGFGRSVIEPSNTSAAKPTDSCSVG